MSNTHILKELLDEIPDQEINEGCFIMPDELWNANDLTSEEKVLYMLLCYYKSNGQKLPDTKELASKLNCQEKLAEITLKALEEKGITYE